MIAIATPNLTDGDGVGNDVLGMARALRAAGRTVRLFADTARVPEDVAPLADLPAANPDALIYHHSIRCDAGVRAVELLPCRRVVVKYHNVTPPRFFRGVNADAAAKATAGLAQSARLAASRAEVWVDSAFNARELGVAAAELPPFHQTDRLHAATADARAAAGLDGWGTVVLCVGRVAPNKNLVLAVDAFAEYRRAFDPTARLVIAGEHVFQPYSEKVAARVEYHDIEAAVIVAGRVTVPQLKALYLTADALLVTSDHEGFGVPLVEAMSLGVPVVAVPAAAVPDTAGDAARYADATPEALAAALHEIVTDGESRERGLAAGFARYEERFATPAIERRFLELFGG